MCIRDSNYAINHQIPILNFSGSGTGVNDDLSDAISNYPGLLVCSAGNGKDHDNNDKTPNIPVDMDTDSLKFYPACYPNDNIISVANTTSSDQLASTSNYGATTVDLGAPGSNIYSTIPGGSYDYKSGTSMALSLIHICPAGWTGTPSAARRRFPAACR